MYYPYTKIKSLGGSINNLYAVMIARQKACPAAKELGLFEQQELVMFVSEDAEFEKKQTFLKLIFRKC